MSLKELFHEYVELTKKLRNEKNTIQRMQYLNELKILQHEIDKKILEVKT